MCYRKTYHEAQCVTTTFRAKSSSLSATETKWSQRMDTQATGDVWIGLERDLAART